jgi:dolichol-phosphate mannosyltransferase
VRAEGGGEERGAGALRAQDHEESRAFGGAGHRRVSVPFPNVRPPLNLGAVDPPPDISVVIACYDEEDALPALFAELDRLNRAAAGRGLTIEVLFVDDGSRDGTAALLSSRAGARVLGHAANRGFGAAMRTGFAAARGRVIVCYDADATYPVLDVLRLHDALEAAGADVAGATPFGADGIADASPLRVAMSRAVAGLYRLALRARGPRLTVYTCAFRAYRAEALRGVTNEADDFLAAAELLVRLVRAGARVVEVPSRLTARVHGRSKMRTLRTALRHLHLVTRLGTGTFFPPPRERAGPRAMVPSAASVAGGGLAPIRRMNRERPMRIIEEHPNPAIRAMEERRRRAVVRLAAARPGDLVLDIGSEEGAYARRLAAAGARPIALDLDREALGRGRAGHGRPAVAGDAHALPLRTGAVPRAVLAEVLEHCEDPAAALAEALRVVAPGGRVAISVPDDARVLAAKRLLRAAGLRRLFRGLPDGLAPGHLRVYRAAELRALLVGAGRVLHFSRDPFALAFLAVVTPDRED